MSLHDRLYAARATRAVQEQQRWAEGLRAPESGADLATVTPLIPAPRVPSEAMAAAAAPETSRP